MLKINLHKLLIATGMMVSGLVVASESKEDIELSLLKIDSVPEWFDFVTKASSQGFALQVFRGERYTITTLRGMRAEYVNYAVDRLEAENSTCRLHLLLPEDLLRILETYTVHTVNIGITKNNRK